MNSMTYQKGNGKMKTTRIAAAALTAALLTGAARPVLADASVTLDIASAYVFRGITFNDGPVVQPGIEVTLHGLTIGAWGNLDLDDYDGAVEKNQFSEIDWYLAYGIPVGLAEIGIGYTEYTFPGAEGDAEREVSLGVGFDVPLAPELAVYYGVDGGIEKDLYLEAGLGHGFALMDGLELDLGATIGYLNPDEGKSGFSAWSLTAGLSYGMFGASVTYYGQLDDKVLPDGPGAYDVEIVGMLSLAIDI